MTRYQLNPTTCAWHGRQDTTDITFVSLNSSFQYECILVENTLQCVNSTSRMSYFEI